MGGAFNSSAHSSSEFDIHGDEVAFIRDNDANTYIYSSKVKGCRSILFADNRNLNVVPSNYQAGTRISLNVEEMALDRASEVGINRLKLYFEIGDFIENAKNEALEVKSFNRSFQKVYNCFTSDQKLEADTIFGLNTAQSGTASSRPTDSGKPTTNSCDSGKTLRLTSLGKFCLTDFEYSQILRQERDDENRASRQRAMDRLDREKAAAEMETRRTNALNELAENERQRRQRSFESTQRFIDKINERYDKRRYCTGSFSGNSFNSYCF